MNIKELGYTDYFQKHREENGLGSFSVAERRKKEKAFGKVAKHHQNLKKQSRI